MHSWTTGDVQTWLQSIALEEYGPKFKEHAIDGNMLVAHGVVNERTLEHRFGVKNDFHMRKLLSKLEDLSTGRTWL